MKRSLKPVRVPVNRVADVGIMAKGPLRQRDGCLYIVRMAKHNTIKIILSTHDDLLQAQELAQLLVESRAAACVNMIPNIMSVFSWEDELQNENEILMIIKTTPDKVPEVQAILEEQHSYEVPEIIEFDATVLHKPYMEWIRDCLAS